MMILRRYGKNYLSVTPNFDSRAMTEIGFMRSGELSVEANGFGDGYELVENRVLQPTKAGSVQGEVEEALLKELSDELAALESGLGDGQVLVIENEQGVNHPKTRGKQGSDASGPDTRLTFEYTVDAPLGGGHNRAK
jgi:hypothetical protein